MMKYALIFAAVAIFVVDSGLLRLKRDDDEVKECDKKCKSKPLELSFVVDGSASIWPENFTYALNFIQDFVDTFDIAPDRVRVSMVTYGEGAYRQDAFGFSRYSTKDDLKAAISRVPYRSGQWTDTGAGILYALREQIPESRPGVRQLLIVLTDGNSQEKEETRAAANEAARAGLEVFSVGVGSQVSLSELYTIASDYDHVFHVDNYKMLDHIKDLLKYKACGNIPGPSCKQEPMDLSFVIDSSVSIGDKNFSIGMEFVSEFVNNFQIDSDTVRVSAITFAQGIYTDDAFNFGDYNTKKAVMDRLDALRWKAGPRTDTWRGIEYMRTVQMSQARPSVPHVCIVITDGASQEGEFTAEQARAAQAQGIIMYAVGVGQIDVELNEEELISIAGSRSRVLSASSYATLNVLKDRLIHVTCEGVEHAAALLRAGGQ